MQIEPYYDRTDLINVTTDTVQENLIMGMVLVTMILLMFLSNVRGAIIVAINVPLALLFAFAMLYTRGKSANLLSIGAVDFGIIVDSSVIMIENIYRKLSAGEHAELPLKERILFACLEVEKPLFFSTAIIICAFVPLFTMTGPEGQLFGPMADTYAFALGGALLLALMLRPCLGAAALQTFEAEPRQRPGALAEANLSAAARLVSQPSLVHAGHVRLPDRRHGLLRSAAARARIHAGIGRRQPVDSRNLPAQYLARQYRRQMPGRPLDHGLVSRKWKRSSPKSAGPTTAPTRPAFTMPSSSCPCARKRNGRPSSNETGWRRWVHGHSIESPSQTPRTKNELIKQMNDDLSRDVPGVDWNFSQNIRDNVMEALSGVKGDNSIKIFGPDLKKHRKLSEAEDIT